MIFSKSVLIALIEKGDARYTGGSEAESRVRDNDVVYAAVDRLDLQRVDHYEI